MIAQDFRKKVHTQRPDPIISSFKYNPSMGKAYLAIASMYAKSARDVVMEISINVLFLLAASEALRRVVDQL